jgi:hypothetical protein
MRNIVLFMISCLHLMMWQSWKPCDKTPSDNDLIGWPLTFLGLLCGNVNRVWWLGLTTWRSMVLVGGTPIRISVSVLLTTMMQLRRRLRRPPMSYVYWCHLVLAYIENCLLVPSGLWSSDPSKVHPCFRLVCSCCLCAHHLVCVSLSAPLCKIWMCIFFR